MQDVGLLAQPGLDLAAEIITRRGRFAQRSEIDGDLDAGDQRCLLVLGEQSPRRAGPVDLLGAQQWDVGQFVTVEGAAQRRPHPVDDAAIQRPVAVRRRSSSAEAVAAQRNSARPRRSTMAGRRSRGAPGAEVVRRRVGDERRPDPLPRGLARCGRRRCRGRWSARRGRDRRWRRRAARRASCARVGRDSLAITSSASTYRLSTSIAVRSRSSWTSRSTASAVARSSSLRRALGDGQLETDREVQLLRVAGGDAQPAPLGLQNGEPRGRGTQLMRRGPTIRSRIAAAVSGVTTGAEYCGLARSRSTSGSRIRLTVPAQRAAVGTAEHLDAGADRPPCRGRSPRGAVARRRPPSTSCGSRAHPLRIGTGAVGPAKVGFGSRGGGRPLMPCPTRS